MNFTQTVRLAAKEEDWAQVAALYWAQSEMHGTQLMKPDMWRDLVERAKEKGVDLEDLKKQAEKWEP